MIRDLILIVTGLAVGVGALLVFLYGVRSKPRRVWHALAWLGVTGVTYIIGRYVVYPQAAIPYTALVGWFTTFMAFVVVGGAGIAVSRRRI